MVDEGRGQTRDILRTFPQRRHVNTADIQTIIQILSELAFVDQLLQRNIVRADHTHVDIFWTGSADTIEAVLLQDTQQLGLHEGESTVGTKLNISHVSATPVGLKVWAESEVTAVDGKRLEFKVATYDEKGLIGEGTHERFIITDERFLGKAARKLEQ